MPAEYSAATGSAPAAAPASAATRPHAPPRRSLRPDIPAAPGRWRPEIALRSPRVPPLLLHKPDVRSRHRPALRPLFDRPVRRLEARNVFAQRAPDPLGMPGTHNYAAHQFPLRPVRENVHKIQRKLFRVVLDHHQVAVQPLHFLFVRLDLHLSRRYLLLIHVLLPKIPLPKYHSPAEATLRSGRSSNRPRKPL